MCGPGWGPASHPLDLRAHLSLGLSTRAYVNSFRSGDVKAKERAQILLKPGVELTEWEPGIYTTGARVSRQHFDRWAGIYDFLIRNRLYNGLMWGTKPASYVQFAEQAHSANPQFFLDAGCGSMAVTAEAHANGKSLVIGIDSIEKRLHLSREMGDDEVIDFTQEDPVAAIKRLTDGRGVDIAIEALGKQQTFEWCLDATRPGGVISSLGVYGGKLEVPLEPFVYGIGDKRIVTTLCPGGKERMRKLMEMVRHKRLDLTPLLSHKFTLDQIEEAYELFGNQREGVVKVALTPS